MKWQPQYRKWKRGPYCENEAGSQIRENEIEKKMKIGNEPEKMYKNTFS